MKPVFPKRLQRTRGAAYPQKMEPRPFVTQTKRRRDGTVILPPLGFAPRMDFSISIPVVRGI